MDQRAFSPWEEYRLRGLHHRALIPMKCKSPAPPSINAKHLLFGDQA